MNEELQYPNLTCLVNGFELNLYQKGLAKYEYKKLLSMNETKQCDCETLSNCCGASIDTDILICYECKEHCDIQECECEVLSNNNNTPESVDNKQP